MRARFVLGEVVIGLRRNLTMTMALIVTIAISLALLGTGLLVRQQVDQMKGFWFDKVEVSLFLCTRNSDVPSCAGAVNDEQREAVAAELESMKPLVQEVYFETADEAYARFQEQFAGSPIADSATPEDLGESFRVKLSDPNRYSVITSAFTGVPGIERVDDQKQVLDKLFRLLDGLQMVALFIAGAMLIVTLMLVGNTMRLAAHSRQRETGIMRLVGASKWYIQMPFILESMVAAIVGGALAIGALVMIKVVLVDGFLEPNFKFTPFVDWDTVWVTAALVFTIGVSLSAIAAFVSLRKYLKV